MWGPTVRTGTKSLLNDLVDRGLLERIGEKRGNMSTPASAVSARLSGIALTLNTESVPTARGARWSPSTISRVLRSLELNAGAAP